MSQCAAGCRVSLYDWKRTKDKIWKEESNWSRYGWGSLRNVPDNKYFRFSVQLNLYRELFERYYGYTIGSMYIVRFHPTADRFHLVEVNRNKQEVQ